MRVSCRLVILAAMSVSCGSSQSSVGPTVPTVTATFAGTLSPNGLQSHPFAVNLPGKVTITVTPAAPAGAPSTVVIGVGVGQPLNVVPFCGIFDGVAVGLGRSTRIEPIIGVGSFCAAVYDIGELTSDVSYTMTVVHP